MSPLPLSAVKTLGNYDGLFWLCIECRECHHRREIPAQSLARRFGRDARVLLRYFEHQGRVKKAISVLKKRTGAHEESIRELWFDGRGVHLSEPLLGLRGVLAGVPVELRGGPQPPARDPSQNHDA